MSAHGLDPAPSPGAGAPIRPDSSERAQLVEPRGAPSRAGRLSRRSAAISGSIVAVAWLVLVFGSALADVNAAQSRAQQTRDDNAALQIRLDQGRAEIDLIQTDAFLRLQARAYGLGERGERAFALEAGTPLMEPIVPLGDALTPEPPRSPLDEWLRLLFG